jgi:hypothetical protein
MNRAFLGHAAVWAAGALTAAIGCATPEEAGFYAARGGFGGKPSDASADSPADGSVSCDPGKALCGTACVNLSSDLANCGACKNGCQIGQICTNGACTTGCAPPKISCGGGCVDPLTDNTNCGGCGKACTVGMLCSGGTCGTSCGTGLTQCSGVCVNLQSDNQNCGSCAKPCSSGMVCSQGACNLSCQAGLTDCQGTCANLQTDNYNCGGCGIACGAGKLCTGGGCAVSCQAGQTNCGGTCANLLTDNANCGACGQPCGAGTACNSGKCVISCPAGQSLCNGQCANLQTDNTNCGACGTSCGANKACSNGQCVATCQAPTVLCGSTCVNVQNDPDNCGGCSTVCSNQNMASRTCGSGVCNGACAGSWGDCDNNKQASGCETPLGTQSNCGTCGHACAGGQTCQSGVCQSSCSNTNVAPQASVSISGGGDTAPYVPARANDNVLETQNCTDWAWISADTSPSGAWIEYNWGSAVQLSSMHMDTESSNVSSSCGNIKRTLGAATIQYWNGSWVTLGQVAGQSDDWDYSFGPVTTTRLRLYDLYATNGSYNPVVFEWQVFGCN